MLRTDIREVLFVGGLTHRPAHDALARQYGWKLRFVRVERHTRLASLYKLLESSRIQLLLITTQFVRSETKRLVLHARKLGVTVIPLPGTFSAAQIAYRLNQARGGQPDV